MHISDGILSFKWVVAWYIVAALFIILGMREIKNKTRENPAYMPALAIMGAAVFIISVWHFPVPVTGSSSHPVGTPMAAILIGGFSTVVVSTIALVFQLFLAHGGVTTIGANAVSMGIVGTFSGLFTYKVLRKLGTSIVLAAGFAGFVGDILTYATTSAELALSLAGNGSVLALWKIFMLGFAPTQVPLAAIEFAFTAGVIKYIVEKRPEMLQVQVKNALSVPKVVASLWLAVLGVIVLGAYLGAGTGDLGGTDAAVEDIAVKIGNREATTPIALDALGENIAFTAAGLVAGIVVGYYFAALFEARKTSKVV